MKSSCQNLNQTLTFNCADNSAFNIEKTIGSNDSLTIQKEVNSYLNFLINQGYLKAEVVRITADSIETTIEVKANKVFEWDNISYDGKQQTFDNKDEFEGFLAHELSEFENYGYPFCKLITQLKSDSNQISGEIYLDKGPLIVFDSIILQSSSGHSFQLIRNFLEIKEGEPYSEKLVRAIDSKIRQLPYLKLLNPPSVIFQKGKALVYLNLERVNSKSFNGIVGVQPNTDRTTFLTGEINLDLLDGFKRGERIKFNWQRINNGTQEISLKSEIPYLLKSKLGLEGSVQIYRRDSMANRLLTNFSVSYNFNPRLKTSLGILSQSNNTNSVSTSEFQNTKVTGYNLEFKYQSLDKTYNPRSGVSLSGSSSIGSRTAQNEKKPLVLGTIQTSYFRPIKSKSTAHLFVNSQANFTEDLFSNELEQIGGLGTIRGVDHRSILVSKWLTAGIEYRFLFEEKSNFMLFTEKNFYQSNNELSDQNGAILAVGLGLNIGTKSGIFNFFYSLAKNQNSEFKLNQGKINFGFISEF